MMMVGCALGILLASGPTWDELEKIEQKTLSFEIDALKTEIGSAESAHLEAVRELEQKIKQAEQQLRQAKTQVAKSKNVEGYRDVSVDRNGIIARLKGISQTHAQGLSENFSAALVHLEDSFGVYEKEAAPFFDKEGRPQIGEISFIGSLAARTAAGASLVPTGEGGLREVEYIRSAQDWYLFEPGVPVKIQAANTVWERFVRGGVVMWPIAVLGLLGILIALERTWTLRRMSQGSDNLVAGVIELVQRGKWGEAAEAVAGDHSPTARLLSTVLQYRNAPRAEQEDRASETVLSLRPKAERFLSALSLVAGVAPLLGLLGTVTGMIATFWVLTEIGDADPKALSGGISEALLTTQFGLVVAVPAVLLSAAFSRWAERLLSNLQIGALRTLNAMESARGPIEVADG